MSSKEHMIRSLKALESKLDALEDAPEHDIKIWMQGYHDCLSGVIRLLGGEVDEA